MKQNCAGIARDVLEFFLCYQFDNDFFVRLDLEHLQDETDEVRGFAIATIGPTNVVQLAGHIDETFR